MGNIIAIPRFFPRCCNNLLVSGLPWMAADLDALFISLLRKENS
jgi:hypothetical protein